MTSEMVEIVPVCRPALCKRAASLVDYHTVVNMARTDKVADVKVERASSLFGVWVEIPFRRYNA